MEKKARLRGPLLMVTIGINMVVATFIGLMIGVWLDGVFSTKPLFTIAFLLFGIAAGFKNVFQVVKRYGPGSDEDREA
ncbi:MAG: AtpZ/AtpI family protein [Deltaproteobacteria bacterium]|nr:AtpZ/AtpI family protein [Deltaproteobacteria bacterium]